MYKCVPDVFSLEESSSNSNTSFHRQKGCLRLCFLGGVCVMCAQRDALAAVGAFAQNPKH